jgi:hypothetical protein
MLEDGGRFPCGSLVGKFFVGLVDVIDRRQGNLFDQIRNLISALLEGLAQVLHLVVAIGADGLFDEVVEEALDEGAVGRGGVGGELGDITGSAEGQGAPVFGMEVGLGVDRLAAILLAPAADPVVVLEAETEGIDRDVAAHAVL